MIGAIGVGLLYQIYYGGGDTFTYFTHGSRHIWEAFTESPFKAFRLIFLNNDYQGGIYEYARKIWVYRDSPSYMVVRMGGLFSIPAIGTYSGTALFFAVFSFSGIWAMYQGFYKMYPELHKPLAYAILFIPSAIFWGSGILKDTLTLGAIGWATWGVINGLIRNRRRVFSLIVLFLSLWIIFSIKKYIVLCFIPSVLLWIYLNNMKQVKSIVLKVLVAPAILVITILGGYLAIEQISKEDPRYALDRLGETAMITAMDIGYWTGKEAGSKYSLGMPDPTLAGMLSKAPAAVNVTLFRPYLWEINSPLMLIAGLESFLILITSIYLIWKAGWRGIIQGFRNPTVIFCLCFALTFAFAVGISTYNFGSLARYKIPLLSFYLIGIVILYTGRIKYNQNLKID